jgi:acetyl-CoA acetyltransferase
MNLTDSKLVEIIETFTYSAITAVRTFGLALEIVNVSGGAISHEYPSCATGRALLIKLAGVKEKRAVCSGRATDWILI